MNTMLRKHMFKYSLCTSIFQVKKIDKYVRSNAEQRRILDSTHKAGSGATPLDPPSNSPHISGKVISLSLLDNDRNIVLAEVQRLKAVSLVAHMEGSRPNRPDLCQTCVKCCMHPS